MTNQEFSSEFDILYNNIMSNKAPGLDEYEKSVFLTKAQEEIVISSYTGKNPFGDSFEENEEVRRYLSSLVRTYSTNTIVTDIEGISKSSVFFRLPEDLWFITYESVIPEDSQLGCKNGKEMTVIPVSQDDYFRTYRNPFRGPSSSRVLRLDVEDRLVELISDYKISKYLIRYIERPEPIILINLPPNLSINGVSTETECKLDSVIHRAILDRAVQLAIYSMTPNTSK